MPLHLLGKKSWNVYSPANIARVKADEAAAAAREAAEDQRLQELDAARRAAILRGETPPPLPDQDAPKERSSRDGGKDGRERKRRRLAGEDDTDRDIRLATSVTAPRGDVDSDARVLKLRKTGSDAPLTDHAGNINLFPIDHKEAMKREKNEEAEREKRKREREFEDQYTMRFSNAAGREGLEQPWYASRGKEVIEDGAAPGANLIDATGFESKDVWGNEDPLRRQREQARMTSSDPFAFMQKAQVQLKKSKEDKKRWTEERERELRELRATQERDSRRERHGKRKKRDEGDGGGLALDRHRDEKEKSSRHRHRQRDRSRSRERRHDHRSSRQRERRHSRSRSQERGRDRGRDGKSSRRNDRESTEYKHRRDKD